MDQLHLKRKTHFSFENPCFHTPPIDAPFIKGNYKSNTAFFKPKAFVQPKLSINEPGDKYEQEADQMADLVVQRLSESNSQVDPPHIHEYTTTNSKFPSAVNPSTFLSFEQTPISRLPAIQTNEVEEIFKDEEIQRKPEPHIFLMADDKGSTLMAKRENAESPAVSPETTAQLFASKGGGDPLPKNIQSEMERGFGVDFSKVRTHTCNSAVNMSKNLGAKAFTHGSDIYFNRGEYVPESQAGRRLLGHELAHVVQQGMGVTSIQRQLMTSRNIWRTEHEGTTYWVRRTRLPRSRRISEPEPMGAGIDVDSDNITITITWCRGRGTGTRGEVQIGANLPEQALDLAQNIAGIITRDGNADEVLEAIRETDVTPFVEAVISRSRQWSIFVRGDITVSREGVTAGSGSIGWRSGAFDLELRGEGSEEGGSLTARLGITPGQTDEEIRCRREVVRETFINRYLCERMEPAHQETQTQTVDRNDNQTYYLYFNYANEVIDEGRSQPSLDAIRDLLGQGYRVLSIEGFTSPEGTVGPGRRFVGNQQLGQDRADAGMARISKICSELGSQLNMRGSPCVENVLTHITTLGQGELYGQFTDDDGTTSELQGREMQQFTIDEFRVDEPEGSHRTETFLQSLEGLTQAEQADLIYPLLRRAVVVLTKVVSEQQTFQEDIPAQYQGMPCPPQVLEAARAHFGLQDIL